MPTRIKRIVRTIKNMPTILKNGSHFDLQYHTHATFGKITASIIHDILTPITTLSIGTDLSNIDQRIKPALDASSKQIQEFVSIMRDFLHERASDEILNINDEIRKSLKLMSHKANQNGVSIEFVELDTVHSRAHPIHVYQILINLVSNAIEASSESKRKNIIIVLKKTDQTYCIECKDFGTGIDKEHLQKLFEPHFTTKQSGFGLGLYSVKFIITNCLSGDIQAYSEPGNGSLFSCILPIRE